LCLIVLCALCSLEWKKGAIAILTSIICRHYSTLVFTAQWQHQF
jgi:hypothetical protein